MSTIKLKGSSSGEAEVTVAAAAGTPTFTLPTTVGSANQLLKNSGTAGTLEYSAIEADSNGDLGLGTTPNNFGSYRTIHIKGPSGEGAAIRLQDNGDTADSSDAAIYKNGTALYLRVNGTDPLIAYMNGAERFKVESGGNATVTDGDLVIGTSGHGIDFSANSHASGMTSELLDSYEEGTFTPTVSYTGTTDNIYSEQAGHYTKIGNFVYGTMNITWDEHNSTGGVGFSLPFTSASAGTNRTAGYFIYQDGFDIPTGGSTHLILYGGGNSSVINAYFVGGNDSSELGPGSTYLSNSHTGSANTVRIVFHYRTS